ncbi:MAG: DUF4239 domain-containing protein [Deltaproteobacteria bacterium]|nr:DUF4239 domain-containing protein [Deltaproteobacteria bacterium]
MNYTLVVSLSAIGLLLGMVILMEVGRRIGIGRLRRDPENLSKGTGMLEGAVFGLLGLLIAFTFSGAASRFENRLHLVVEEANAIGTAYLRIDLLPNDTQPEMRELFRRYLDIRAEAYRDLENVTAFKAKLDETASLQGKIWAKAVSECRKPGILMQTEMLLIPALNAMFDITTTRSAATRNHPPMIVFFLLIGSSLIGSLLAGYGMAGGKERSWLHMAAFVLIISLTTFVILDLEFPRLGLIRIDAADQILIDLRKSMQ